MKDVTEKSPAAKAGFMTDDVITKFDGKKVRDFDDLVRYLSKKRPGDKVSIELTPYDLTKGRITFRHKDERPAPVPMTRRPPHHGRR